MSDVFPQFEMSGEYSDDTRTITPSDGGLTKRELFAAMVLQGLSANSWLLQNSIEAAECGIVPTSFHSMAVESADRLLAELAKERP